VKIGEILLPEKVFTGKEKKRYCKSNSFLAELRT